MMILRGLSINDDNRRRITEAGGIQVVLDTMQKHAQAWWGVFAFVSKTT